MIGLCGQRVSMNNMSIHSLNIASQDYLDDESSTTGFQAALCAD